MNFLADYKYPYAILFLKNREVMGGRMPKASDFSIADIDVDRVVE